MKKFISNYIDFQKNNVFLLLFAVIVITLFFSFHTLNLEREYSMDSMSDSSSQYETLKSVMKSEFNQTDSFFIYWEVDSTSLDKDSVADIRQPEVFQAMSEFQESLENETEVNSVISPATIFQNYFGKLPESKEEAKQFISLLGGQGNVLINKDNTGSIMFVSVNVPENNTGVAKVREKINTKVENASTPKGINLTFTGEPSLIYHIINLTIQDAILTIIIATLLVFIIVYLIYGELNIALFSVVPIIFMLIWLFGTMNFIGLKLNVITAILGTMLIGIGADYSIHISNAYFSAINSKKKNPLLYVLGDIGGALTISYITTFAGFSTMMFVSTPAIFQMGFLLCVGISYAFIGSMFVLPLFLILNQNIIKSQGAIQ